MRGLMIYISASYLGSFIIYGTNKTLPSDIDLKNVTLPHVKISIQEKCLIKLNVLSNLIILRNHH